MDLHRTVSHLFVLSIVCTCLNAAEPLPSVDASATTEVEALPVYPVSAMPSVISDALSNSLRRSRMLAGCKVAPLSDIWDPEVQAFEKNAETAPADIDGLTLDTAEALDALRDSVMSVGGTFDLKSAYRPPAYQAHLREVWVKWVKQLRNNRSSGCRALREEVGAEFKLHQLLVKQPPVPASDHTLGLAFDAAVMMPRSARLNGKRVTVDKLAALAGMKRPDRRRDPVHFKLVAERPPTLSYAQTASF